jgi:hypothetical protein
VRGHKSGCIPIGFEQSLGFWANNSSRPNRPSVWTSQWESVPLKDPYLLIIGDEWMDE